MTTSKNELQTKLDAILEDKNTNLLPENIKKDITCLGVTGTYKGIDTSDATASASDIIADKTAYANGKKITGTIAKYDGFTELQVSNSYSSDDNLIVRNDSNKNICLTNNAGLSVSNDVVAAAIRLTPDIIKEGSQILGLTGTLKLGVDTTDATATADNIQQNKTAYVNGKKVIGAVDTISGSDIKAMYGSNVIDNVSGPQGEPVKYLAVDVKPAYINGSFSTPAVDSKAIMFRDTAVLRALITRAAAAKAIGLTSKILKKGYTILDIEGTVEEIPSGTRKITTATDYVSNNSLTDTSSNLYIKHTESNPILISASTAFGLGVTKSALAEFLGITADILKKDTSVLNIIGTYIGETGTGTEDATATATDILQGKTAYVNKAKITGTLPSVVSTTLSKNANQVTYIKDITRGNTLKIVTDNVNTTSSYKNGVLLKDSTVTISLTDSQLAAALGLTSDMIAEGTTFLGITGTYTGDGMLTKEEYNQIESIADDILAEGGEK